MVRPKRRIRRPTPPPRVRPPTPVWLTTPAGTTRPCRWVARSTSPSSAPPPTVARRVTGSTVIRLSSRRSITMPPSQVLCPGIECPPPRTAIGRPPARAKPTAAATSGADRGRAISAGLRSCMAFQIARAVSGILTGGLLPTPHLFLASQDPRNGAPLRYQMETHEGLPLEPGKAAIVKDGMWAVVNEPGGTGGAARIEGHDVAGKTGTSQVISNKGRQAAKGKTDKDLNDHGWFVFYAPRDNPQIAGVVFLEHGVHGGNAAMVVHHILDAFFAKKEGRPLPPQPVLKPNMNPSMG